MPWNNLYVKQSVCVLRAEQSPQSLVGTFTPEGLIHGVYAQKVSRRGDEDWCRPKLMFARGLSLAQSPTGATASLCSQTLHTLTLEVQLLPKVSLSFIRQQNAETGPFAGLALKVGSMRGLPFR